MDKDILEIIRKAPTAMQDMLVSVYQNNSFFKNKELVKQIVYAMSIIDREYFFPGGALTYEDYAMPIGEGQTISQPTTVARTLMYVDLKHGEDVLEVGSGSGWNACLIAYLIYPGKVVSLDIIARLVEKAKDNYKNFIKKIDDNLKQKFSKLEFMAKSITDKEASFAKHKYDKIIITAGIELGQENKIEEIAKNLLKDNGKLICPYQYGPMLIFEKHDNKIKVTPTHETYGFVPLVLD